MKKMETPKCAVLYRRSIVEITSDLSETLPEKSETCESGPKIVDCQIKTINPLSVSQRVSEENTKAKKAQFLENLNKALANKQVLKNYEDKDIAIPSEHEGTGHIQDTIRQKLRTEENASVKIKDNISDETTEFHDKNTHIYAESTKYNVEKSMTNMGASKESDTIENQKNLDDVNMRKNENMSLNTLSEYEERAEVSSYMEMRGQANIVYVNPSNKIDFSVNSHNIAKPTRISSHIYEEMKLTMYNDELEQPSENTTPIALIKELRLRPKLEVTRCTEEHDIDIDDSSETQSKEMATLRPKSPKPIITKTDKEETFWDKIGTLGRKKRSKEVQEVQEEGKYAIDSPGFAVTPLISPEEYDLEENEERSIIMPKAFEDPKLKDLIQVLIDWINDELASQRIIVQDLTEDLYDGQVLQKLFEMLTGYKLDVPEVTQSEEGQKQKLSVILSHFDRVLGLPANHCKWSVEVIHSKSVVPILHLLVALARHFRPPVRLPENVSVPVTVVRKTRGRLEHRAVRETITAEYADVGMRCERDAFDALFDHAPDKLQVVKKSLVTFVNKHLNKLNLEVTEIESQFHDGVYLIMLMGLLEGFFVPLYSFFPTPKDQDHKVHNVSFAFQLMEEVGLARPKARPEDVVNLDLKSTLRVLYNLFNKYKTLL